MVFSSHLFVYYFLPAALLRLPGGARDLPPGTGSHPAGVGRKRRVVEGGSFRRRPSARRQLHEHLLAGRTGVRRRRGPRRAAELLPRSAPRLAINAGGPSASRERPASQLAGGEDRLFGKRLVIYQFSERELSSGDWALVDLGSGFRPAPRAATTPAGPSRRSPRRVLSPGNRIDPGTGGSGPGVSTGRQPGSSPRMKMDASTAARTSARTARRSPISAGRCPRMNIPNWKWEGTCAGCGSTEHEAERFSG